MQASFCQYCGQPIERVSGHRARRYCDNNNTCKQLAHLQRQAEKLRDDLRQLVGTLPLESQVALEELMQRYDLHAAELALDVVRHCFDDNKEMMRVLLFFRSNTRIG